MTPHLSVNNLKKSFPIPGKDVLPVIDGISFTVDKGDFLSIMGPGGCGKTTLLEIIAGIKSTDSGEVTINGGRGGIALVFQEDDLFPWLTVEENMLLALKSAGKDRSTARELTKTCLANVDLAAFAGYYPSRLSGGMKKRASLARALSLEPELLLMDEPSAHLDEEARRGLHQVLLDIAHRRKQTMILVTHDLQEALSLSRKVMILSERPSRVLEIFDPKDLQAKNGGTRA
ncbi:MAG: ATP-binding cassette domain-containing protein [Candidatus Omnitrophota bacterium]